MRINHLADSEIQAYLDRRRVSGSDLTVGDEVHEHIDGCARCREELNVYEHLFSEIAVEPEISLPRNFAKKVTLSLPPLAAARTRARIHALLTGLASAAAVILLLALMSWKVLATLAATSLTTGYVTALTWIDTILSLIPVPDLAGLQTLLDLTTLQVIKEYVFAGPQTTNLLLLAAMGILLIASLEGIMPIRLQRQEAP